VFAVDKNTPAQLDAFEISELKQIIKEVFTTTLNKREERIVALRFGFGKKEADSLEEVGREFQVSRESIRQIEKKALKKLTYHIRKIISPTRYNGENSTAYPLTNVSREMRFYFSQ